MITKDINEITEDDLQELINNAVLESKTIEYKQQLPGNTDDDKKKFLAAVSSFANTSGGDLVYGITEDRNTGAPQPPLDGLTIQNVDQEKGRLENMIGTGIEPRIPSITIRSIPLSNANVVLIIRIPKSWNPPHRISFKKSHKFYARHSHGKYLLDVGELRTMFTLSETLAEKTRSFRESRLSKIRANETFVPLRDNPKIVLHLIPFNAFAPGQRHDISTVATQPGKMYPMYSSGLNHRYNLDGLLTYYAPDEIVTNSYTQLYRNGIIEAVECRLLRRSESLAIPSVAYEKELIKSLNEYLSLLKELKVGLPVFLFLSLLEVEGFKMAVGSSSYAGHGIDRDVILIPEVIIEDFDVPADKILRPCFDSIWNACGLPNSPYYDDEGNWTEIRR